ncbi:MAG: hypothetical protein FWH40_03230 [Coriobacteriia bacterium]|nr:hypothetical protein [Coriobacteriia bacterium]
MSANRKSKEVKIGLVVDYSIREHMQVAAQAYEEFMDFIDPDPGLSPSKTAQLSDFALEWFVFDYKLPRGISPIEEYIRKNPDRQSRTVMRRLEEAFATQFVARFWLDEVRASESLLVVQPYHDETIYRIRDRAASYDLDGQVGTISIRLAKIEDEWLIIGNIINYQPIVPSERMRKYMLEAKDTDPATFIDIVKLDY